MERLESMPSSARRGSIAGRYVPQSGVTTMLKRILRAFFGGDRATGRILRLESADVRLDAFHQQPPSPSVPVPAFVGAEPDYCSALSPNGSYSLTWHDADWESGVGGCRKTGHGGFQLGRIGSLVLKGKLQRPNDGKVADDGTVIFNDWLFGDGLKGEFCAFTADGRQILKYRFRANLSKNAISADGKYALCTTCVSDNDDSDIIAFFSLGEARLLWKRPIEPQEPRAFVIDPERKRIEFAFDGLGAFAWDFGGFFLDRDNWVRAVLERGDGPLVQSLISGLLTDAGHSADRDGLLLSLAALDRTLGEGFQRFQEQAPKYEAFGYRLKGEVLQALGNSGGALAAYERAIQLDDKVGVKRRVAALRKAAGSSEPSRRDT